MNYIIQTTVYLTVTSGFILIFKRLFKNKMSAKWHLYIWALLLVRFLMPPVIQSGISVFNVIPVQYTSDSLILQSPVETDGSNISEGMNTVAGYISSENDYNIASVKSENNRIDVEKLILYIWAFGAAGFLLYFLILYSIHHYKIKRQGYSSNEETMKTLDECKRLLNVKRKIRIVSGNDGPMLMGIINPKIILPDGYSESEKRNIIIHELCHFKNGDILIIWVAILLLCLNWFNPVMWYSFFLLRCDIEVYCDQRTLKYSTSKKEYANLLLKTALGKNKFIIGATSLQNGEKEIERRIKYMAYFKKPKVLLSVIIVILAVLISALCLTNAFADYSMSDERLEEFLEKDIGAIMADIDYADKDKVVFHYLDGMFVYNLKYKKIEKSFDLTKFNCAPHQQGSFGLEVTVSDDGETALLSNYGSEDEIKDFENYVINLTNGRVKRTKKEELENPFTNFADTYQMISNVKGWFSNDCIINDNTIYYLTCHGSQIGDMKLCERLSDNRENQTYIFFETAEYADNTVNATEDIEIIKNVLPENASISENSYMEWNLTIDEKHVSNSFVEIVKNALEIDKAFDIYGYLDELKINPADYIGRNLDVYIYDVILSDRSTHPYLFIMDRLNNEMVMSYDLETRENVEAVRKIISLVTYFSVPEERADDSVSK